MHEKWKLAEATYFYGRLLDEEENGKPFLFNLSAFLSAARSCLQYAWEEVRAKGGSAQSWYDGYVSNKPVLKFFKQKRDVNIHEEPVKASKQHIVITGETMAQGIITSQNVDSFFAKSDWPNDIPVVAYCRKYLDEVLLFIEEGVRKGFISG